MAETEDSALIDQLRSCLQDRYELERELGGGGMSRVFVARERALNRRVVIKVLSPELGQSVNAERFRLEIATSATLQHPQIIPVYGTGACGDLLYFVMPFIAGESLRAHLDAQGKLDAAEVRRILTLLARGLAYAHREGIVHRDIKPENILLAQGEPMLADFGIAKVIRQGNSEGGHGLTSVGMSIGTVVYMAPEQVVADPAMDGRADVYSLAALGFELLSGRAPFLGTPQQVMSAHVVTPPPDLATLVPTAPGALTRAIMRGLSKEAADRPDANAFAELLNASEAPHVAPQPAARNPRTVWYIGGGVGVALAAVGLIGLRAADTDPTAQPPRAATTTPVVASNAVAVLPFESIGAPDKDDYFAAGLTAEVMSAIGDVPGLRVISKSTVSAYADSALPPRALGERVGAAALVEGSVQRAGDRLRITARLIDARDGTALWSERYDRTMADVFTTQSEISTAIVTALAPRLGTSTAGASSVSTGTTNPAAYDLFLRARFALDARDLRAAIDLFRQATVKDPSFARAHAGIAEATALLPVYGGGTHASLSQPIRDAANTALRLDSTLASPHTALGFLAKGTGDWTVGEREFRRASALQPTDGAALQNLGELLFTVGRFDEATVALASAARLEPLNAGLIGEFAYALMLNGQLDSAQHTITRSIAIDGRNPYLHYTRAVIAERRGEWADARSAIRTAIDRKPLPFFLGVLAHLDRVAGDSAAALRARARLRAMQPAAGTTLALAIADASSGEPAALVAQLDRAVDEQDPLMYLLPLRLWWFDRLRTTPEFAAVSRRLGLPDAARAPMPAARP